MPYKIVKIVENIGHKTNDFSLQFFLNIFVPPNFLDSGM